MRGLEFDQFAHQRVELGVRQRRRVLDVVAPARVLDLLGRVGETVAIATRSAEYRTRLRELLDDEAADLAVTPELSLTGYDLRDAAAEMTGSARHPLELPVTTLAGGTTTPGIGESGSLDGSGSLARQCRHAEPR